MSEANPFETQDDETPNETGAGGGTGTDSANLAEVRAALKREEKRRKELEDKLKAYDAEKRDAKVLEAFTTAGLTDKQAKLFSKLNPDTVDVTPDTIKSFAEEYGYELPATSDGAADEAAVAAAAAQTQKPDAPAPTGFKPVTTGTTDPGLGVMSLEDAKKAIADGRYDEVNKLYQEGKVEKMDRNDDGSPKVDWLEGVPDFLRK